MKTLIAFICSLCVISFVGCERNHVSIGDAIDDHILFEMSDPTLMENESRDSLIFIGLVFDHSENADSLLIVASYLPPFWFNTLETYIGIKQVGRRVYVYSNDCPHDTSFVQKITDQWLPSDIDNDYSHYLKYFENSPGGVEHYYINISTYVLGRRNRLMLIEKKKKRWPRK